MRGLANIDKLIEEIQPYHSYGSVIQIICESEYKGRWIKIKGTDEFTCNKCKHEANKRTPHCPNCGARMK